MTRGFEEHPVVYDSPDSYSLFRWNPAGYTFDERAHFRILAKTCPSFALMKGMADQVTSAASWWTLHPWAVVITSAISCHEPAHPVSD